MTSTKATVSGTQLWHWYRTIPEFRFLIDWTGAQIGRHNWTVTIDGTEASEQAAQDVLSSTVNASAASGLTVMLYLSGRASYIGADTETVGENLRASYPGNTEIVWYPLDQTASNFRQTTKDAIRTADGIWPDPADPRKPASPLASLSELLAEIELLQRLMHAQNNNRLTQRGILAVASEIDVETSELEQVISAPLTDPGETGAEPIVFRVPGEQLANGSWFAWERLDAGTDGRTDERLQRAIDRLARSFPLPPEILQGMTSTNRATAFQIEQQTYSAYLARPADIVAHVFSEAATGLAGQQIEITPDPAPLFARPSTVADVQWAWPNGLITAPAVRTVLGIAEDDAATPADLELLEATGNIVDPADDTGGGVGIAEAVAGAANVPGVDLDRLTEQLAAVDDAVLRETIVKAESAAERSLERLGAKIRSAVQQTPAAGKIDGVPNGQVPFTVDPTSAGIDAQGFMVDDLADFRSWWLNRWTNAEEETLDLIAQVAIPPEPLDAAVFDTAADTVIARLAAWALDPDRNPDVAPDRTVVELPDNLVA